MSVYKTSSDYPDKVDDLVFISDVSISTHDIYKHHEQLIEDGKYSEAADFINHQTGITPVTADFFNMLENRIKTTQTYLLSKNKVNLINYSSTEPEDITTAPFWISDATK